MTTTLPELTCECCNVNKAIGVASIPGIPMSIAWCRPCLDAGAIPMWAAVANTAMCGGLDHAANWWQQLVADTLAYFDISIHDFNAMVAKEIVEFEEAERKYLEPLEGGT